MGHFFPQNFWGKKCRTDKKYQQALYVEIFSFERGGGLEFFKTSKYRKRDNIVTDINLVDDILCIQILRFLYQVIKYFYIK